MKPRIRLARWHELLVLAVLAGLLATGVVWLVFQYLVAPNPMGMHPVQAWSVRIHGALAMAMLLVCGSLLPNHVSVAWRSRRNRRSGSLMLAALLGLAVTGWLLYYASSEALRDVSSLCHWIAGLLLPALLGWHLLQRHKARREA